MKRAELAVIFLACLGIAAIFFYKFLVFDRIPFPGDLLVAEYKPWRTYSYLGYNPGSYPQKAQYFDTLRQIYPWKTYSLSQLRLGTLPLWNPHNFSGGPLLANNQSAIFYPFTILYFFFSQPIAWAILTFLQPLFASFGAYLFARKIGIGKGGSMLTAVSFGYSLFMTTFLEYNTIGHVVAWLPCILYSIELLLEKTSAKSIIWFTLSVTFSALAGHLQIFGLTMALSFLYLIRRAMSLKRHIDHMFMIALLLPFAISAVQLIPTFELIRHAARAPQEYQFLIEKLLIQPYQLILFLGADLFGNPATYNYLLSDSYPGNALYIGIIPFIFAVSVMFWKNKNLFVRLFTIASLGILMLIVRTPLTELVYRLPIPFISSSSPTNMIFLLSFCLSVLAGFGFDYWASHKTCKPTVLYLLLAILLILWSIANMQPVILSSKNLLYTTLVFAAFVMLFILSKTFTHARKAILIGVILLSIADSYYFFQKFNSFVPRELVYPEAEILTWLQKNTGLDRFWGIGAARIESNIATQYGLYSAEGYDPLYPKWYGEFLWSGEDGKLLRQFSNATRSDAAITTDIILHRTFVPDSPRKKIIDLLGIKYILDRSENASGELTFPVTDFKLVYNSNDWKIFENLKSYPRAWMVHEYELYQTAEDFEKRFFDPSFDPQKTVLLKDAPPMALPESTQSGQANITAYTANEVIIDVSTPTDQILVLSDTNYPGWHVTVDAKESKIMLANWAFRGVFVPAGLHTIRFIYNPMSFSIGIKTTMIGLLVFFVLCISLRKSKYE